jgi:chemotaxis protein CheX
MKLDVEFINPFLAATLKTLEVQASTKATPGKPFLKEGGSASAGDISGVIGITADKFNGSVVISFPEQTFLKIMSRMLGEEFTVLNKEIADGAGELTNIIFGQAKITLNEKGYGIKMAIPSVISGKNHVVHGVTKGPVVMLPFETDLGPFFIEISLS